MVVRPCLTRVNVFIARGLLGPLRRSLSIYETTFRIRLPLLAHGWKSSSFTFSRKLDLFFKLPISFSPSHSPLFLSSLFVPIAVLFPAARQVHCLRQIGWCTNAKLPGRDNPKGVAGSHCLDGTFLSQCDYLHLVIPFAFLPGIIDSRQILSDQARCIWSQI